MKTPIKFLFIGDGLNDFFMSNIIVKLRAPMPSIYDSYSNSEESKKENYLSNPYRNFWACSHWTSMAIATTLLPFL